MFPTGAFSEENEARVGLRAQHLFGGGDQDVETLFGTEPARGADAAGEATAWTAAPAGTERSRSVRGRTLILNPSGLIVSVSFRCIW